MWSPEKAIHDVKRTGIDSVALCVRDGKFAQPEVFAEVVRALVPKFISFDISHAGIGLLQHIRPTLLHAHGQQLVVVEATTVRMEIDCLMVLDRLAAEVMKLRGTLERVIPLLVIDMEHANTRHPVLKTVDDPEGPAKLLAAGNERGLITVPTLRETLRDDLSHVLGSIVKGKMPDAPQK